MRANSHCDSRKSLVYGVGINDLNNTRHTILYRKWVGMLERCYSQKYQAKFPTYTNCRACVEWHTLSNFKTFFDENYIEGYVLDKDILVKGNKVYSPETCCFVPQEINKLFITHNRNRGPYPLGVRKDGLSYRAQLNIGSIKKGLGSFPTPESAFLAYKKAKEQYIKELAEKYYKEGKITERVYLALLAYRVEITD